MRNQIRFQPKNDVLIFLVSVRDYLLFAALEMGATVAHSMRWMREASLSVTAQTVECENHAWFAVHSTSFTLARMHAFRLSPPTIMTLARRSIESSRPPLPEAYPTTLWKALACYPALFTVLFLAQQPHRSPPRRAAQRAMTLVSATHATLTTLLAGRDLLDAKWQTCISSL